MSHAPNTTGKYKWIGSRPDRPDGADKAPTSTFPAS